jgi:hypothetical protein
MDINGHVIPALLERLIEEKKWSTAGSPPIDLGVEAALRISPRELQLVLMPPPFHTIADEVREGNNFWNQLTNVGEIDYSRAVIIADFGLGSDSPIILYYGHDPEPDVMYLEWPYQSDGRHEWVLSYDSFDELAIDLDLEQLLATR